MRAVALIFKRYFFTELVPASANRNTKATYISLARFDPILTRQTSTGSKGSVSISYIWPDSASKPKPKPGIITAKSIISK